MNKYEIMFIVKPDIDDETRKNITEVVAEKVTYLSSKKD